LQHDQPVHRIRSWSDREAGRLVAEENVSDDRIVVTGMGAVSCFGPGVGRLWEALVSGRCGIRPMTRLDSTPYRYRHCGEVPAEAELPAPEEDLAVRFAIAAIEEALGQASLDRGLYSSVVPVLASNFGAMSATERLLRSGTDSATVGGGLLGDGSLLSVTARLGLSSEGSAISLSCASGNAAIGYAADLLRGGYADMALAVGYDAISEVVWAGLSALRAMSEKALRPFDRRRDGTIFSEGAGALLLERLRHARDRGVAPLAEFVGSGTSSDAFHMTHPEPAGRGMVRAMRAALADACIGPEVVDHVNAHATGTRLNDRLETAALKEVFGPRARVIPVSAIKSMIGHAMGAASSLEAIATVMTLRSGVVPPTIGLEEPDPDCDLDYVPGRARRAEVRVALNNAAGFGGCNAAVIFRRWDGET